MKINFIELQGFASYKNYNKIVVPQGITGIVGTIAGVTGRSNGCGKSKALMAILFALYGSGTFDKMEEIWNVKLSLNNSTFVRLDFDLIGNNYFIERGKKGGTSYLLVRENQKKIGSSIRESQAFINDLLGMDEKMFLASAFVTQGDLDVFIKTEPSTRRKYVDSFLELSIWRDTSKATNRRVKDGGDIITSLKQRIREIAEQLADSNNTIGQVTEELKRLPEVQKQRIAVDTELKQMQSLNSVETTIRGYREIVARIEKDIERVVKKKKDTENELTTVINEYVDKQAHFAAYSNFDEKKCKKEIAFLEKEIEDAQNYIQEQLSVISDLHDKIFANTLEERRLKNICESLNAGKCDKCHQEVTREYIIRIRDESNEHIRVLLAAKADLEVKHTSLKEGVQDRTITIDQLQKQLTERNLELDSYNLATRDLTFLEERYKKNTQHLKEEITDLSDQLEQFQDDLESYNNKIAEAMQTTSTGLTIKISQLADNLNDLDADIANLNIKQGILQKTQEMQTVLENNLEKAQKKLKDSEKNIYYLGILNEAFKDIPTALLKESVGEIEQYANEIIRTILPKFRVRIYEDESKQNRPLMIAFEVDGKYRNYKLLSGGQQSLCAIGLRIGFNRIISNRAKVSLGFLVLDEIFSSLDKVNRIEVMKALSGLTTYFPQILIITHTEEASIFPNTINVFMDEDDISYIT